MTRDTIITTVRDALRGAGIEDEARVTAAAGNIAQVWLLEQEYQNEIVQVITALEPHFGEELHVQGTDPKQLFRCALLLDQLSTLLKAAVEDASNAPGIGTPNDAVFSFLADVSDDAGPFTARTTQAAHRLWRAAQRHALESISVDEVG